MNIDLGPRLNCALLYNSTASVGKINTSWWRGWTAARQRGGEEARPTEALQDVESTGPPQDEWMKPEQLNTHSSGVTLEPLSLLATA